MSQKNSIGQSGPASITHNQVRRPVRSVQELGDALGALPVLPTGTAPQIVAKVAGPVYGPSHPGHARFAKALTDGDLGDHAMLPEIDATTRTIMAGNGVIEAPEAFDEFTGPAGEIAHAVIVPPETLSSASGAMIAPRATTTPAACASVAGGFTLSDNQRASLQRMALIAASTGNFDLMFSQIEALVSCDRFDRAITEGGKSIGKAFGHAAEMVRTQTRKAVARCNACPKCGKAMEHTPAEPDVNIPGGYDCSDPDCGYQRGLEGGAR